jgi:hypothetical protein
MPRNGGGGGGGNARGERLALVLKPRKQHTRSEGMHPPQLSVRVKKNDSKAEKTSKKRKQKNRANKRMSNKKNVQTKEVNTHLFAC